MLCVIAVTKCRLCGKPFDENICTEDWNSFWKDSERHPLEDATPWCQQCLERMNEVCDAICADIAIGIE